MTGLPHGATQIAYDGHALRAGAGPGRCFEIDARCLRGVVVPGAYAHVCALPDESAVLEFDQPEVQQVRRDALAWWIALLGDALVCLTTLAVDESRYGGATTVTREPVAWSEDPVARIFRGTVVRTESSARPPHRRAPWSSAMPASPGREAGSELCAVERRDDDPRGAGGAATVEARARRRGARDVVGPRSYAALHRGVEGDADGRDLRLGEHDPRSRRVVARRARVPPSRISDSTCAWYLPMCVSSERPLTSPIAYSHASPGTCRRSSTSIGSPGVSPTPSSPPTRTRRSPIEPGHARG